MSDRKPGRPKRTKPWPQCKAEGCKRTSEGGSLGFCHTHYVAARRGVFDKETGKRLREDLRVVTYGQGARCKVVGCERRPKANGFCHAHWQRQKKGQDLSPPVIQKASSVFVVCLVEGCERRATSRGMCQRHASQRERGILDEKGSKLREPGRGGRRRRERWVSGDGYVLVHAPEGHPGARHDGSILEHRLLMEQLLGRHLKEWEIVHHKDGNRSNNCTTNLELLDGRARKNQGHPPGSEYCKRTAIQVLLQQPDLPVELRYSLQHYRNL